MDNGLLVVKRFGITESYYVKSDRLPTLSLLHEDVLRRYRGIEGTPWPDYEIIGKIALVDGLLPLEHYEAVAAYYDIVSRRSLCDFLYIQISPKLQVVQMAVADKFIFLGYDYAYYGSEYNCYSSLYNEIIYGTYEEMRYYAKYLNEHLLLPSTDLVENLIRTRQEIVEQGASLETIEPGEEFRPIAVYGQIKH